MQEDSKEKNWCREQCDELQDLRDGRGVVGHASALDNREKTEMAILRCKRIRQGRSLFGVGFEPKMLENARQ
jgi:hypothetical protein